jgi:nucleotide-binding universal stress UspA family protein
MEERMKVLIAYDASGNIQLIVDDLRRAGLPRKTEAIVISVADVETLPAADVVVSTPSANDRLNTLLKAREQAFYYAAMRERHKAFLAVNDALQSALQAGEQIKSEFPAWNVRAEAYAETPAMAIIRKADDWGADLIVVGSHKQSTIERLILGSVSQKVVNEANHSVRVARGSFHKDESPARILIGLDGSSFAEKAAQSVAKRAWPVGSEARLVTIMKLSGLYGVSPEEQRDSLAEMQRSVEAMLREAGLKVSSVIREGAAKSALVAEAEGWDADCIFVGSRGLHSPLMKFFLGSVSASVVANATCSVEVTR